MSEAGEKITINAEDLERAVPEPIRIHPDDLASAALQALENADFAVVADFSDGQSAMDPATGKSVVTASFSDEAIGIRDGRWRDIPDAIPVEPAAQKTNGIDKDVMGKIVITLIPFVNSWAWWRFAPQESPQKELYRSASIFLFGMSIIALVTFGLVFFG